MYITQSTLKTALVVEHNIEWIPQAPQFIANEFQITYVPTSPDTNVAPNGAIYVPRFQT